MHYGIGGFNKKDFIAMFIAWYFTKEAALALYLVIFVDAVGGYLTLHKTYLHPDTETPTAWIVSAIGAVFTTFSVGSTNIILLSYSQLKTEWHILLKSNFHTAVHEKMWQIC
ncbi:MAG: hypothetical protein ACR2LN_03230 [Candidatus Levyibacteriota bacterium]